MLACRFEFPFLCRRHLLGAERVGHGPRVRTEPAPVDPAAQVGGLGDVGRCRDDPVWRAQTLSRPANVRTSTLPNASCVEAWSLNGAYFSVFRHRGFYQLLQIAAAHPGLNGADSAGTRVDSRCAVFDRPANGSPFFDLALMPSLSRKPVMTCSSFRDARVVVFVPCQRQAPAFDRVGDKARWRVVIFGRPRQRPPSRFPGSAHPEFAINALQLVVAVAFDQSAWRPHRGSRSLWSAARAMPAPPRNVSAAYRSFGHSLIQRRSALPPGLSKRRHHPLAVLEGDHVPAGGAEYPVDQAEHLIGHDAVQSFGGCSRRSTSNCGGRASNPPTRASYMLPSSISASPTSATMRPAFAFSGDTVVMPARDNPAPST